MKKFLILWAIILPFFCFSQPSKIATEWFQYSDGQSQVVIFDPSYQAVLDRATVLGYTKPSAAQQIKQNQLVLDLKAAGIWTLLDVFYVFATDGDSDFATLNWKNPAAFQCSKVNSPTFTINEGFQGNGTSSYLDTNWTPSTNGVNFTLNSASLGVWVFTIPTINDDLVGNSLGSSGTNRLRSSNTTDQRINSTNSLNSAVDLTGTGYKSNIRNNANSLDFYSGLVKSSRTAASTSLGTVSLFLLRRFNVYSNAKISMAFTGNSLNESLNNLFNNIFSAYISSL